MSESPVENSPLTDPSHVWLQTVYQGDRMRQLSMRSVITGMLLGGIMSISNLYVGLKTGWGLGVTITASIIAYSIFQALERIVPAWRDDHFTILENYTMTSAASAAGYMSSAGLVAAIPALYMTTGRQLLWWELMSWIGAISILGVFMAIPMKRQMINIEQLPFPAGIATAETLKSMHSSGGDALLKARALLTAGIVGVLIAFFKEGWITIAKLAGLVHGKVVPWWVDRLTLPEEIPFFPGKMGETLATRYTMGFEGSAIMMAAGAIMGIRAGVTMLFSGVFFFGILGSWLISEGIVPKEGGYGAIVRWTLWPATSLMVTSGLLSFALRWKTVIRSFSSLIEMFTPPDQRVHDPLNDVEVPDRWFFMGTFAAGALCVLLGWWLFKIEWWMGIIAVLLTFLLSIVAARATGETDITPIGAMGKITQLTYGLLHPKVIETNLMTASITAGAASHCADLLTDLKTGYLLGGNPRKQLISQLFGVLAGTLFCVPIYLIVVKPEELGTAAMPAPSAKVWASVAELLSKGVENLPQYTVPAMIIGGVLGIFLALLEEFAPANLKKYLPSTTALGIGGVIPAFNSIAMFLGAFTAFLVQQRRPDLDEKYTVPVSSGLIAGQTLMGVFLMVLLEGPGLIRKLFGG